MLTTAVVSLLAAASHGRAVVAPADGARAAAVRAVSVSDRPNPLGLTPTLTRALDRGAFSNTPKGFRVIALSHLADGCAAQGRAKPERLEAARACVAKAAAQAWALAPDTDGTQTANGLWLTHYALVLGAGDALGACPDAGRHEAAAKHLVALSAVDAHAHAPSYASMPYRWPADQTAVLAAVARYDAAHGTHLADAPLARWRDAVPVHAKTDLPVSEVTGTAPGARLPRGCAQSYISRYLAEVDPALAATWWKSYRAHFLVDAGPVVGFREWPRGVDRKADVDSGPIIMGIGVAASALGIAAARAQGDEALARRLESLADTLTSGPVVPKAVSTSTLAQAIRFEARWQPRLVP